MKKLCYLLLTIGILSCSADNDDGPKPPTYDMSLLLRTWTYDQVKVGNDFQPYPHNPNCFKDYIEIINGPQQPYQFNEQLFQETHCAGVNTHMRWEPDGDHLNLYFWDYIGKVIILEVSETQLHAIYEADFNGDGDMEQQEFIAVPAI